MPGGIREIARQAAAAARTERPAQEAAAMLPVRKYRGVQKRGNRYNASVWNHQEKKTVWLGSYATPEEAAYAYDAAARTLKGRWAKPNFRAPGEGGETVQSADTDQSVVDDNFSASSSAPLYPLGLNNLPGVQ